MALNIILGVCMYPVIFLLYFIAKWMAEERNSYRFGASFKKEWEEAEEMIRIKALYLKSLKHALLIFALCPILIFFVPYTSICITLWMIWMFFMLYFFMRPFFRANRQIRDWKLKKGLETEHESTVYIELKESEGIRKQKHLFFYMSSIVSVVAVVVMAYPIYLRKLPGYLAMLAMIGGCTLIFHLMAYVIEKQKLQVISTSSEVNLNYNRAKRKIWAQLWLILCWLNTGMTVFTGIVLGYLPQFADVLFVTYIVFTFLLMAIVIICIKRFRRVEEIYEEKRDLDELEGADRHWIGGMFYYNKKDKHSMVEQRTGIGLTVNMATTFGKIMMLIALVAILSIPVLCVWVILLEFTPIHLYAEKDVILAEHLGVDYEIPFSDIEEIEVVSDEPEWTKVSGSEMENLAKGTFDIYRQGKCEAFLNPQNNMFLKITTEDSVFYMGGYDDEETRLVYEEIINYQRGE